jgi:hypothetical protein
VRRFPALGRVLSQLVLRIHKQVFTVWQTEEEEKTLLIIACDKEKKEEEGRKKKNTHTDGI